MSVTPHTLILNLELCSGRLIKERLLTEAFKGEWFSTEPYQFESLLKYCFDSFITFGIKNIPLKAKEATDSTDLALHYTQEFIQGLEELRHRRATGDNAVALVETLMHKCPTIELWNSWYRRILLKDLKCGVDVKTVNKVFAKAFPEYKEPLVNVFECQLAQDSTKYDQKMVGKKIISVKLDGVRALAVIKPQKDVRLFSRNGKELLNFPSIIKTLQDTIVCQEGEAIVLDGEIMSKSFQDLMKQIYRKENVETQDAVFYVFDYIPLQDFQAGYCAIPQASRLNQLEKLLSTTTQSTTHTNVILLDYVELDLTTQEGSEQFKILNQQAIKNHYEGLMIKDPQAPYECKRTSSWLKLKPYIEVTLTVIEVEEGTGKNAGKLGALLCKGKDDGKNIVVSVGGGFSDEERQTFWHNQEALIGHLVEVRADAITLNQQSDNLFSLRFPRFLRFRGFEAGEKL